MKTAFRISSICILIFAIFFFGLVPAALHNQITTLGMIVMLVAGILMIISIGITFSLMLILDSEKKKEDWRDLDSKIKENEKRLKEKHISIY